LIVLRHSPHMAISIMRIIVSYDLILGRVTVGQKLQMTDDGKA
jgi:hypothetical protein